MEEKTDVVVVGGGPCGSFSALTAAKLGAEVVVCEEHEGIGTPTHCAGHISISGLKRLGLRLPQRIIENEIKGATFYSPSGKRFIVRRVSPVTIVINRELFDRYLSELAMKAGARYLLRTRVKSLWIDRGCVAGIITNKGHQAIIRSNIVINAEGCPPTLLRKAGMPALDRSMVVNAVQVEVDQVQNMETDMVEIYLGEGYAPGFFAWIIPRRNSSAKVGLATRMGDPRRYLHRLIYKHPIASEKLRKSKVLRSSFHPIPLGGPIFKTYSNGLLIVGDAASQVKPTTGGGIIFGLLCSRIAGEVAHEALEHNDFSEDFLSEYESRWRKTIGFDMKVMLLIRQILNRLTDRKLDEIIELCTRLGLNEPLEEMGDVDFEGSSLIRMIHRPRFLMGAFRLFLSYLFL